MNLESTVYSIQSVFHPPMYPIHRVPIAIDRGQWRSSKSMVHSRRDIHSKIYLGKPSEDNLGSTSSLTSRSLCDDDDDEAEEEFFIENMSNVGGAVPPVVPRSKIMRGNPFLACSCPSPVEQWNALYRRFYSEKEHSQLLPVETHTLEAVPRARRPTAGTLSQVATRMFNDCARAMERYQNSGPPVPEEWVECQEVPLTEGFSDIRPQFWKDYQQEEQCRVNLTE